MRHQLKKFTNTSEFRKATKAFFQILFLVSILIASFYAEARTLRVAIVDTGINPYLFIKLPVCGTKDFTGQGINDVHGHGSHIAAIIADRAGNSDYCLIIIKFYNKSDSSLVTINSTIKAFRYALEQKADIINYSGGGTTPWVEEKDIVLELLNKGVIFNAAAGNSGTKLTQKNCFYPACYDSRINVIGSNDGRSPLKSSNWGKIRYRQGEVNIQVGPDEFVNMIGTSQATAIFTGEMIHEKAQKENQTFGRNTARH